MEQERRAMASSAELAAYLNVSRRTVETWAVRGTGPRYARIGRHRRYRWADVDEWLTQRTSVGAA
ncbi:helix-turn-helix domain-containing protein [Solwaraspora sp. WMMD792]|uniref:helix-turn-helix transcriptional regulator n=1 Tax=Solwaraspora sp. WMMD792 TaxID=3016099 RepID=UPI002415C127|nr:helix-turn-helix domain-containing protein [Solwaraspora sp. WMMD792]MDG4770674.1 helix-turn-helix domain-containing protein [Solwaraspora sp. WMMD792]